MRQLLLIGKDGQVGTELQRSLAPLGTVAAVGRQQADLADLCALEQLLTQHSPNVIVNAAAYTAVDQAQSQPALAQRINAEAVAVMAGYAKKTGALLVHYSTDYVFDGTKTTPYVETDPTAPLNKYGQSKLGGEDTIIEANCAHLIFRTSWVYAPHSHNFLRTMMHIAMQRQQLSVVSDQVGAPTSAALIADITALAIWARGRGMMQTGRYHLSAAGQTSWYGFAKYIIEQMVALGMAPSVAPESVLPIPAASYPTPAKRPSYSVLDSGLLEQALGIHMPPWQLHAAQAVAQLSQYKT